MLTRNDMLRLSQALPNANQMAFDAIMPSVNSQIRAAAVTGLTFCEIDIPTILESSPAYDYEVVCEMVLARLRGGTFTVETKDIGLYHVHWGQQKTQTRPDRSDDDTQQVRIVYTKPSRRRRKTRT